MSFKKRYQKDNDALHIDKDARKRIGQSLMEAQSGPSRADHKIWVRAVAVAACAALLALGLQIYWPQSQIDVTQPIDPTTYDDIYARISEIAETAGYRHGWFLNEGEIGNDVAFSEEMMVPSENDSSRDFSTTNTQIEGVDEADIVKTDGDHIYILADNRLVIVRANGKDTKVVSDTEIGTVNDKVAIYPMEMFMTGNKLIVLFSENEYIDYEYERDYNGYWYASVRTVAAVYDISDPTAPSEISRCGQDGYYVTSRMREGIVYLITTHSVYDIERYDPKTFVPCTYRDGVKTPMAADRVVLPECPDNTSYAVITSMYADTGVWIDQKSVLGYTDTVYMNHNSLVIAQGVYEQKLISKSIKDQYKVEHFRDEYNTHLVRFSVQGGNLTFKSESEVAGGLLNQFSIDEHNGYVRLVTSVDYSEYKIYTDEKYDFINYEYIEGSQTNALYVLDSGGKVVGELTDIAKDERVYSVRFAGDIGYFVTFRQVDPLFAVDLSDPKHPTILSELKIPGFSQYLHVYDDGLLFGLGMEADIDTGRTTGMKLSMFDVSDPADVTERHKLVLDTYYSEALYNHKAILVLPEKDIIAFPTDNGYAVYGYSERGFYKRGEMEFAYAYTGRGVVIDNELYVCTVNSVGVFELDHFTPIYSLNF